MDVLVGAVEGRGGVGADVKDEMQLQAAGRGQQAPPVADQIGRRRLNGRRGRRRAAGERERDRRGALVELSVEGAGRAARRVEMDAADAEGEGHGPVGVGDRDDRQPRGALVGTVHGGRPVGAEVEDQVNLRAGGGLQQTGPVADQVGGNRRRLGPGAHGRGEEKKRAERGEQTK